MKRALIAGCRRSGTTYVGKILSLHKSVSYIEEPFNKLQGLKKFPRVWYPYIQGSREMLDELDKTVHLQWPKFATSLSNRKGQSKIDVGMVSLISNVFSNFSREPTLKRLLRVFFLSHHQMSFVKTKWNPFREAFFIKDPLASLNAELFVQKYKMPVFAIYREPKAYYYSMAKKKWGFEVKEFLSQNETLNKYPLIEEIILDDGYTIVNENIVKEWLIVNSCILQQKLNNPNIFIVNHSDIIKNPIGFIKLVYSKIGLDFRFIDQEEVMRLMHADKKRQNAKDVSRDSKIVNEVYKKMLSKEEKELIDYKTSFLFNQLENVKTCNF